MEAIEIHEKGWGWEKWIVNKVRFLSLMDIQMILMQQ